MMYLAKHSVFQSWKEIPPKNPLLPPFNVEQGKKVSEKPLPLNVLLLPSLSKFCNVMSWMSKLSSNKPSWKSKSYKKNS